MMTHLQPKSQILTVNGLRLHYLDWGCVGAPPVVCIHGFTSCAQAFNALARHFAHRFHLLVPDVRGRQRGGAAPHTLSAFITSSRAMAQALAQVGPDDWEKRCSRPTDARPIGTLLDTFLTGISIHRWDAMFPFAPQVQISPIGG